MSAKKICGIYSITCKGNGKIYVGSSSNIHLRWLSHKSRLKNNKHSPILYNTYKKYGLDSLDFKILEECELSFIIQREQYWYDYFKNLGYGMLNYSNIVENATRGVPLSEERKKHLRIVLKGKPNVNKGKKTPESICKKISESLKGRKMSKKNKDILREYITKPKSIELRKKFSDAKKKSVGVKIVCLQTGEFFDSLIDASNKYDVSYQSIRQSIKRKGKCNSLNFYYADHNLTEEEIKEIIQTDLRKKKKKNKFGYKIFARNVYGKKVIAEELNKTFISISESAEFFKVSVTTIRNYIKKNKKLNNVTLKFI